MHISADSKNGDGNESDNAEDARKDANNTAFFLFAFDVGPENAAIDPNESVVRPFSILSVVTLIMHS